MLGLSRLGSRCIVAQSRAGKQQLWAHGWQNTQRGSYSPFASSLLTTSFSTWRSFSQGLLEDAAATPATATYTAAESEAEAAAAAAAAADAAIIEDAQLHQQKTRLRKKKKSSVSRPVALLSEEEKLQKEKIDKIQESIPLDVATIRQRFYTLWANEDMTGKDKIAEAYKVCQAFLRVDPEWRNDARTWNDFLRCVIRGDEQDKDEWATGTAALDKALAHMRQHQGRFNYMTYSTVMAHLAKRGKVNHVMHIFDYLTKHPAFRVDDFHRCQVLWVLGERVKRNMKATGYRDYRRLEEHWMLFRKEKVLSAPLWNHRIHAYLNTGNYTRCIEIGKEMKKAGETPTEHTERLVFRARVALGQQSDEWSDLVEETISMPIALKQTRMYAARWMQLMTGIAETGNLEVASVLFKDWVEYGPTMHRGQTNILFRTHVTALGLDNVIDNPDDMPSEEQVAQLEELFNTIEQDSFTKREFATALCNAGRIDQAFEIAETMSKASQFLAAQPVWRLLMYHCSRRPDRTTQLQRILVNQMALATMDDDAYAVAIEGLCQVKGQESNTVIEALITQLFNRISKPSGDVFVNMLQWYGNHPSQGRGLVNLYACVGKAFEKGSTPHAVFAAAVDAFLAVGDPKKALSVLHDWRWDIDTQRTMERAPPKRRLDIHGDATAKQKVLDRLFLQATYQRHKSEEELYASLRRFVNHVPRGLFRTMFQEITSPDVQPPFPFSVGVVNAMLGAARREAEGGDDIWETMLRIVDEQGINLNESTEKLCATHRQRFEDAGKEIPQYLVAMEEATKRPKIKRDRPVPPQLHELDLSELENSPHVYPYIDEQQQP